MGLLDKATGTQATGQLDRPDLPCRALEMGPMRPRPEPKAKNNYILITLDSCRYDSFMTAAPKVISEDHRRRGRAALELRLLDEPLPLQLPHWA